MLTLLTKINNDRQLQQIDETLRLMFEGLKVDTKILGTVAGEWVQIAIAGEDEKIATNYLLREVGLCPNSFRNIKKFSMPNGYVLDFEENGKELLIDVGVFEPKIVHAIIPLQRLQAQLVGGRQFTLGKIAELFGFCKNLLVNVKITYLNEQESRIEAELSNRQISKYVVWRESLLDRLLVLGASFNEVKMALEHAKLYRDVIDVESLGLLEHVLTCKLGTDAAGLIPKIGRDLNAKFAVFNPKRLQEFLKV